MTEQLEFELRTALRERAAKVPAASIARLTHLDYHPRIRRLRPPLAIGALASAAGAAGAAAIVISLSAGASNAFAGWSPRPTAPAPDQLAGLPLKLADTRGPFTFSVYADSNSSATCIKGPTLTAVATNSTSAPITVPAGHIMLSSSHASNHGGAYSWADGRTGDDVSAVTLTLDDGTSVQATVANGWFVAWWPGSQAAKSAAITTPSGTSTQTFDLPNGGPCGSLPCPGGTSGAASGAGGGSASGEASGTSISGSQAIGGGGQVSTGGSVSFSGHASGTSGGQAGVQTSSLSR